MDAVTLNWALKALVTGIFIYAARALDKLVKVTQELNVKVAVVIEQVSGHEKRLNTLEFEEKKRKK